MQNNQNIAIAEATAEERRALINDLIATLQQHPHMTVNDGLNALLSAAANIIAHREKNDRRDYIAVRGFRQILEDVRQQQKSTPATNNAIN